MSKALEKKTSDHVRRFKPYPAYKDSGIEWLGKVPETWHTLRFKYLLSEPLKYGANEVAELDDPGLPRYVRITDVNEDGTLREETFKSLPEDIAKPYLLRDGDLLFARSGATVGKTFYYQNSWGRAAYAGYLIRGRLASNKMMAKFAAYFAQSRNYWDWLGSSVIQATIQNVSAEKYAGLVLGIPTSDEQRVIVAYLDRETARIDQLIAKKERQIELLQEKRSALISHAVTKGLNPKAKMKDSGIEWLGEIPEHWKIKKLKCLVKFISGGTPSTNEPKFWDGDIPWVSAKDMKNLYLADTEDHITEEAVINSATSMIPSNSVLLVVRSGILRHTIPVAITCRDMAINQDIKGLLKVDAALISDYLARFIEGSQPQLLAAWKKEGTTVESLEMDLIANTFIPIPPTDEQAGIVTFLKNETQKLLAMLIKINESIDKLREYRTTLISAAVTGKIDVREEVA